MKYDSKGSAAAPAVGGAPLPRRAFDRYALILLGCVVAAGALILLAMCTYPIHYSWPRYYLSAMGLTRLNDGTDNHFTALIFNSALVLSGVMSASYFILRGSLAMRKAWKYPLWISGLVGGLALAGIGLVPYNLGPDVHNWCTYFASGGFVLAIILCLGTGDTPASSASDNLLWSLFGVFVLLVWVALNDLRSRSLLPSTPTGQLQQKILVAFFWFYMFWNSLNLYRRTRRKAD